MKNSKIPHFKLTKGRQGSFFGNNIRIFNQTKLVFFISPFQRLTENNKHYLETFQNPFQFQHGTDTIKMYLINLIER